MVWVALVLLLLLVPAASAQTTPTIIAGTGEDITEEATRGDGGPATEGRFHKVDGLDWSPSGSILVADGEDGRIRRITPSGNIVTNSVEGLADPIAVVSTGWQPHEPSTHNFVVSDVFDDTVESWFLLSDDFTWEESVAMEDIDAHDVEAALDGYWVTDKAGGTVWHLTFIGPPFNTGWQQAPALEGLDEPEGIGPLPGGGFLVATEGDLDCRIRRRADGVTTVMAGTGFCAGPQNGGHGDGGPATASHLGFPSDVEATADGGYVLIERNRLRRVAPDGTISTIYVTGVSFPDVPAAEPSALEVTQDGDVLMGLSRQVLRFDTNYAPPASTTPPPGGTNPLPPPPPGPDPEPLTATLSKSAYKVMVGKKLTFVFKAASGGTYVLEIRKGKKLAKRFKGTAKAGKNTLKKKLGLPPGRYKIVLKVKAGGETAKDTAKLLVTRPG